MPTRAKILRHFNPETNQICDGVGMTPTTWTGGFGVCPVCRSEARVLKAGDVETLRPVPAPKGGRKAILWVGTLDNLDYDEDAAREAGIITTTAWPARITEEHGRLRLEITASGRDEDPACDRDMVWVPPSRFRDLDPALDPALLARLVAAGELEDGGRS